MPDHAGRLRLYADMREQRSKDYPGWAAGSTDSSST
jgi:hypothetical protein